MRNIFKQSGFTLVELLVAMAILGMLIAGILAAAAIARRSGRDTVTKNNMQAIQLALEDFTGSDGKYPQGVSGTCPTSGANVCKVSGTQVRVGSSTVDFKSGANLNNFAFNNSFDFSTATNNDAYCTAAGTTLSSNNDSQNMNLYYFTNSPSRSTFALATRLENGNCYVLTTK